MKQESLKKVLANSTSTSDEWMTTLNNGDFEAHFPNELDTDFFLKRLKKFDAKLRRNTAIDTKERNTQKKLASLITNLGDCRTYYALYKMAIKAPHKLQPYVYQNAIIYLKEKGVKFNNDCDFYLASIIPPYYSRGWEFVDTHDFCPILQSEKLMPSQSLIGANVKCKNGYSGTVVGTEISRDKVRKKRTWYGTYDSTYYTVYYKVRYLVRYGDGKYQVYAAVRDEIKCVV